MQALYIKKTVACIVLFCFPVVCFNDHNLLIQYSLEGHCICATLGRFARIHQNSLYMILRANYQLSHAEDFSPLTTCRLSMWHSWATWRVEYQMSNLNVESRMSKVACRKSYVEYVPATSTYSPLTCSNFLLFIIQSLVILNRMAFYIMKYDVYFEC